MVQHNPEPDTGGTPRRPAKPKRSLRRRATWKRRAIGAGAVAAVLSGGLAILANLSEIAGWFATDETAELVAQTRQDIQSTDAKVEALLMLLRNQAAVSGLDLDIGSERAIRNAIEAIVASGNVRKQAAAERLDAGDLPGAADLMSQIALAQSEAAETTEEMAANTWRETGALYVGMDLARAVSAYREAARLQPGHPETLEMLGHTLFLSGRLAEAETVLTDSLARATGAAGRSTALHGLGSIARRRGEYGLALELLTESLAVASAEGLQSEQIRARISLAGLAREQGELDRADRLLQQALQRSRSIHDEALQARILGSLGTLSAARGDYPAANERLNQALQIHLRLRDLSGEAHMTGNLGAVALLQGDDRTAEPFLLRSVEIGRQLGWISSIATDLINLGGIAAQRGEHPRAEAYLREAEALTREHGLAELTPVIVYNRGDVALKRGDVDTACRLWAEARGPLDAMGSAHAATVQRQWNEAACAERLETSAK